MRTPRGYKKRYFTLAAIQAMACQCKLRALIARVVMLGAFSVGLGGLSKEEGDEELLDDPPTLLLPLVVSSGQSLGVSSRPCSCNRVFARRARCVLYLTSFLRKICPCRKTKSGLSPPLIYLFRVMYHQINNKRLKMKKYFSMAGILACVSAQAIAAQTASIEEIVVEAASKSEQKLKEITSNVEVITSEELEEKHITTVIDALRMVNIPMAQSGGLGQQSSFFMRGLPSGNTVVLIDGASYNDPTTTDGQAQLEHLLIHDIERIEIIKGAQSGIWGGNAVAGVINIVTKKISSSLSVKGLYEQGSYHTQKYGASLSQKRDKLSYFLGVNTLTSDGYSAQAVRGIPVRNYEADGYFNTTTMTKIGYDFTEKDALKFQLFDVRGKAEIDSYGNPNNALRDVTQQNRLTQIDYTHQFSAHATLSTSYHQSQFLKNDPLGWTTRFKGMSKYFGIKSKISYDENALAIFGIEKTYTEDQQNEKSVNNHALFVTNQNTFGKMIISETLRKDIYDKYDDKMTGKLGLKYLHSKDLSVSVNYGTAYKVPSLYQLNDPTYGNTALKPETTVSKDFTFQWKNMSVTYFDNAITNLIGYDPSTYQNMQVEGTSKITGTEVRVKNSLGNDLFTSIGYNTVYGKDKDGKYLQRRAKNSVNYSLDYYGFNRMHMGVFGQYIGERFDDQAKTIKTGGYLVTHGVITYDVDSKISVFLKVNNLFNRYYQEVDGYATEGRSAYVGLRASF